jgi:hypothetical protein
LAALLDQFNPEAWKITMHAPPNQLHAVGLTT